MNALIQFLQSIDPLLLYAVCMTLVAAAIIAEVQHNTAHDKSDYPSPTEENKHDDTPGI